MYELNSKVEALLVNANLTCMGVLHVQGFLPPCRLACLVCLRCCAWRALQNLASPAGVLQFVRACLAPHASGSFSLRRSMICTREPAAGELGPADMRARPF